MRRFSLRLRLTLLLALATLVALGIAAWIVDWRADAEMQQRFDSALLARAQAFAALTYVRRDRTLAVAPGTLDSGLFPGITDASWYDLRCDGVPIEHSSPVPPAIAPRSVATPTFADAHLADGRLLREVSLRFAPRGAQRLTDVRPASATMACELRYALDRGPLDELLRTLDLILLGSILGACLVVLALTPWLVRRGLRPLSTLDAAMARIGPDAPGERLPPADTRELAPLVSRFNEVLSRMDEGLSRERRFASGLAHELRTRLAELRTLVDVEMRYPSERDPGEVLGEIGKIGGELEATVAALLQLTRIESGVQAAQHEPVDVQALLTRALARHHDALHAHGLRLERSDPAAAVRIESDPALLEIVLDNLLGNAIAYAPIGSTVDVRATPQCIGIANAAPELGEADLARFGQRFWRKRAGEDGAGHAGLGLALAQAAVRALGMRLEFAMDSGVLKATLAW